MEAGLYHSDVRWKHVGWTTNFPARPRAKRVRHAFCGVVSYEAFDQQELLTNGGRAP